jgi:hypothetical protein
MEVSKVYGDNFKINLKVDQGAKLIESVNNGIHEYLIKMNFP